MKKLTIIYVTYNSKNVISSSLDLLEYNKNNFEVIVVDNKSSDGTAEFLQKKYPDIKVIKSDKNNGFGKGNNIGLREVKTNYALILNPDVEYKGADILLQLQEHKKLKKCAISGPAAEDRRYIESEKIIKDKTRWLVGAVMMFDMKKLKDIGFFDDEFFLYYEETDLCDRALARGYEIYCFNSIEAKHEEGSSSAPSDKVEYLKAGCWAFLTGVKAFNENGNPNGLREDL